MRNLLEMSAIITHKTTLPSNPYKCTSILLINSVVDTTLMTSSIPISVPFKALPVLRILRVTSTSNPLRLGSKLISPITARSTHF